MGSEGHFIDKSSEQVKMDSNDLMLKSKGYFIFALKEDGNLSSVCLLENLSYCEHIGLLSWIKQVATQKLEEITFVEDVDIESNESENDDIDSL